MDVYPLPTLHLSSDENAKTLPEPFFSGIDSFEDELPPALLEEIFNIGKNELVPYIRQRENEESSEEQEFQSSPYVNESVVSESEFPWYLTSRQSGIELGYSSRGLAGMWTKPCEDPRSSNNSAEHSSEGQSYSEFRSFGDHLNEQAHSSKSQSNTELIKKIDLDIGKNWAKTLSTAGIAENSLGLEDSSDIGEPWCYSNNSDLSTDIVGNPYLDSSFGVGSESHLNSFANVENEAFYCTLKCFVDVDRWTLPNEAKVNLVRETRKGLFGDDCIDFKVETEAQNVGFLQMEHAKALSLVIGDISKIESTAWTLDHPKLSVLIHLWGPFHKKEKTLETLRMSGLSIESTIEPRRTPSLSSKIDYDHVVSSRTFRSQDEMQSDFERMFETIDEEDKITEAEPAEAVKSSLYPHQKQALNWMICRENKDKLPPFWVERNKVFENTLTREKTESMPKCIKGGILADDMGLGKTLEMISLIVTNGPNGKPLAYSVSDDELEEEVADKTCSASHSPGNSQASSDDSNSKCSSDTFPNSISRRSLKRPSRCLDDFDDESLTVGSGCKEKSSKGKGKGKKTKIHWHHEQDISQDKTLFSDWNNTSSRSETPEGSAEVFAKTITKEEWKSLPSQAEFTLHEDSELPDELFQKSVQENKYPVYEEISDTETEMTEKDNFQSASKGTSFTTQAQEMTKYEPISFDPFGALDLRVNSGKKSYEIIDIDSNSDSPVIIYDSDEESADPREGPASVLTSSKNSQTCIADEESSNPTEGPASTSTSNDNSHCCTETVSEEKDAEIVDDLEKISLKPPYSSNGTLIICPVSVMSNWVDQFKRHVHATAGIKVHEYYGPKRNKNVNFLKEQDVIITTYSTLTADFSKHRTSGDSTESPLHEIQWLRIVLDEGHTIRNPAAKQSKAINQLEAHRRWVLSGTPIQNSMTDLWSLINFLRVETFRQKSWWNRNIAKPMAKKQRTAKKRVECLMRNLALRRTKNQKLNGKPIVDLPARLTYEEKITLGEKERKMYDKMQKESKLAFQRYDQEGTLLAHFSEVMVLILRLRQFCLHPQLVLKCLQKKDSEKEENINDERQRLIDLLKTALWSGSDEECAVCIESLQNPVITPCAHVFCRECIETVIKNEPQATCPLCRAEIEMHQLIEVPEDTSQEDTSSADDEEARPSEWKSSAKMDALMKSLNKIRQENSGEKCVVVSQFTSFLTLLEDTLKMQDFNFVRLDGTMKASAREDAVSRFSKSGPNSPTIFLLSLKAGGVGINLTAASRVFLMDPAWNPAAEEQCFDRCHRLGQTKDVIITKFIIEESVEDRMAELQANKRKLMKRAFGKKLTLEERKENRIKEMKTLIS